MAHQTFYIDIDEEITSIVDRLRKAKAREIIIVVPKRALLIQSIVNLKLLKKEADNLKKHLIIVTQDKLGKLLVEKTGIAVEQRLDDIDGEEMPANPPAVGEKSPVEIQLNGDVEEKNLERIKSMGSAEYFEAGGDSRTDFFQAKEAAPETNSPEVVAERITNTELVTEPGASRKSTKALFGKSASMDIVKNVDIRQKGLRAEAAFAEEAIADEYSERPENKSRQFFSEKRRSTGDEKHKDEMVRNFFIAGNESKKTPKENADYGKVNLSGRFWKIFKIFGLAALIIVILASAYLFLPKADIKIFIKAKTASGDFQIKGDPLASQTDAGNLVVPAKLVTVSEDFSQNFQSTGNKSASGQKAAGTITIYNEYSSDSQPLVATTRFQSPDGKIFRLAKSVVVPGTTNVGGETQPGAIEANVTADQPGAAYNIDPATFTIPGFQGNSGKYAKIYGKSSKQMAGGKDGTDTAATVVAADIDSAKTSLAAALKSDAKQKIIEAAGADAIVLDDALNLGNVNYSFSNAAGDASSSFSGTAKVSANAIVFKRGDVVQVALNQLNKNNPAALGQDSVQLEFGKADTDFTKNTILIRAHASAKLTDQLDMENLKKGILGKSEDDFKAYLKSYPQIESAEINYWPSFLGGKIPAYASRVNIELDNN